MALFRAGQLLENNSQGGAPKDLRLIAIILFAFVFHPDGKIDLFHRQDLLSLVNGLFNLDTSILVLPAATGNRGVARQFSPNGFHEDHSIFTLAGYPWGSNNKE
jgi:hypothetical protein